MAMIEGEKMILPMDTAAMDSHDFAAALQTFLNACTSPNLFKIQGLEQCDDDNVSRDFQPGGYGVFIQHAHYKTAYVTELTGKSPLEAAKAVLDELPKAIENMEKNEDYGELHAVEE